MSLARSNRRKPGQLKEAESEGVEVEPLGAHQFAAEISRAAVGPAKHFPELVLATTAANDLSRQKERILRHAWLVRRVRYVRLFVTSFALEGKSRGTCFEGR